MSKADAILERRIMGVFTSNRTVKEDRAELAKTWRRLRRHNPAMTRLLWRLTRKGIVKK